MIDRGEKIKEIRGKARFSQVQLAKLIGVTRSQVANYETGRSEPDEEIYQKILDIEREWESSMSDLDLEYPSLKYVVRALKEEKYDIALAALKELVSEVEKKRADPYGIVYTPLKTLLQ